MIKLSAKFLSTSLAVSFFGLSCVTPVFGAAAPNVSNETGANTMYLPKQILKTGVSLNTLPLSANALQLSDNIGLTPLLAKIQRMRDSLVSPSSAPHSLERLEARQDYHDAVQQAQLVIDRTNLEIDFAIAEITAEDEVYQEVLSTFASDRDKQLAIINSSSFVSNGALWAIGEGLAIPSFKRPKYAISSGILGIIAGVVPSMFSLYTYRAVGGKKKVSEAEPNMLAKLFGYPTNSEIEYPKSVWNFLQEVPANDGGKKRSDQLIDRWIADANIPAFTQRGSREQLAVITASESRHKGLSIATLTARSVMLEQLAAEIRKMKRMLLELNMALQGEKQLPAS
jgi:hypothetical protein